MGRLRTVGIGALCLMAVALAGCAYSNTPPLPGLDGLGQPVLTPEQQQAKIKQLAKSQADADAAAAPQPAVMTGTAQ